MRLACLVLALPLVALAGAARSESPSPPAPRGERGAEGRIEIDGDTRVEVLNQKLPVGQRIELPEGWFRVEEEGVEDRAIGSFTVVSSEPEASEDHVPSPPPSGGEGQGEGVAGRLRAQGQADEPAPARQRAPNVERGFAASSDLERAGDWGAETHPAPEQDDPCRAERNAYLRELWHASGIEVDDPDAVARGLDEGTGGAGSLWFAYSTDAFRNLAWSSDLRSRARDLARCVNEHR